MAGAYDTEQQRMIDRIKCFAFREARAYNGLFDFNLNFAKKTARFKKRNAGPYGSCGTMRDNAGQCGSMRVNAGQCGSMRVYTDLTGQYGSVRVYTDLAGQCGSIWILWVNAGLYGSCGPMRHNASQRGSMLVYAGL